MGGRGRSGASGSRAVGRREESPVDPAPAGLKRGAAEVPRRLRDSSRVLNGPRTGPCGPRTELRRGKTPSQGPERPSPVRKRTTLSPAFTTACAAKEGVEGENLGWALTQGRVCLSSPSPSARQRAARRVETANTGRPGSPHEPGSNEGRVPRQGCRSGDRGSLKTRMTLEQNASRCSVHRSSRQRRSEAERRIIHKTGNSLK